MLYIYLIISAAVVPVLNNFLPILKQSYSYWLVPLIFVGCFASLIILHFLFFAVCVFLVNMNSKQQKGSKFYRALVSATLPIGFKLMGIEVLATGLEKVPDDTRFLLVCNHQFDFDPAIILSALPESELAFVAKKEVYRDLKFVARVMHALNCLPIDRENNREAVKTILKATNIIKEDKNSIAIFPEGYTSKTCELLPMRNGAFKIATKAKVPIVVCVIDKTREIPKSMFRRKITIPFSVLDVIYPEDYADKTTTEIGNAVTEKMQKGLDLIRKNN